MAKKKSVKKVVKKTVKKSVKKAPEKIVDAWVCRDPRGILVFEKEPVLGITGTFEKGGKLLKQLKPVHFARKYGKLVDPGKKRAAKIAL